MQQETERAGSIAEEEPLLFVDEHETPDERAERVWRILVVDDDVEVHNATRLALSAVSILGRNLQLSHAYSAIEARKFLEVEDDIAVILLDVVMESQDAGLRLVKVIREDMGRRDTRIILRTGQPGYAPEVDVIRAYDINDYRNKSDLTLVRLFTALTSAIRSYDQIRSLESSRRGLSMIIRSSSTLLATHGLQEFAEGVIIQITALLGLPPEGILCAEASPGHLAAESNAALEAGVILAAAGHFRDMMALPVTHLPDNEAKQTILRAFASRKTVYAQNGVALFIDGRSSRHVVAYIDTYKPLDLLDLQLLEVFCTNISIGFENVALFSSMRDAAYVDSLTGLANRQQLALRIESSPEAAEREWLVMLDVDQFSEINDAFGFSYGNALICAIGERLRQRFPEASLLARVGGDTFAVLGRRDQLSSAAVLDCFARPFEIEGDAVHVSISLGCTRIAVGESGAEVLRAASIALKRAKAHAAGSVCEFLPEMGAATRERVLLLRQLRNALQQGRLQLAYQPQIRLGDGALVGVEALLRWRRDDGSFVPPDQFIPLAESSGLIVEIGEWVARQACADLPVIVGQLGSELRVGINVSVIQLGHAGLLPLLASLREQLGGQAHLLEIEITESVAMQDPDFSRRRIEEMKALGFSVAIDDFGTGFSSLAYLQQLAIDRLKIDQRFVRDLGQARGDRLVDSIVQLGWALDLTLIAEGVETAEQAASLTRFGCHEAQGYLYAKPMFAPDLLEWMARRKAG